MDRVPIYTARESFDTTAGERWARYIAWSRLTHLTEVISLDAMLCPALPRSLKDEDWNHNVHADFRLDYFRDLPYLRARLRGLGPAHVLAVMDEPDGSDLAWSDPAFAFQGFDLVEDATSTSALTNCGRWDVVLPPAAIGRNGLLPDIASGRAYRSLLLATFTTDPHADCLLWAVWRMI